MPRLTPSLTRSAPAGDAASLSPRLRGITTNAGAPPSNPEVQYLRCTKCAETKASSGFSPRLTKGRPYDYYCKSCRSKLSRKHYKGNRGRRLGTARLYRQTHLEERRAYDRQYYEQHRATRLAESRDREQTDKGKARAALRDQVAKGHIEKPARCSDCGKRIERRLLHGHHTDYSKRFDVVWLCSCCHGKASRRYA